MLRGALLAESLRVDAPFELAGLTLVRVLRQDVSQSATPDQPPMWTLLEFEAEDHVAGQLADALAGALMAEGGWYANFTVGEEHVVVFAERIFRYQRGDGSARAEVEAYARQVGVPAHQMDWGD